MKILLIEDESALANSIIEYLTEEGFLVEYAADFRTAQMKAGVYDYACILADIGLPGGGSGLDILRDIKRESPNAAFILLSARNTLEDRVHGLELGADDYLTKPFHLAELNARLKALLRRRFFQGNNVIHFEEITVYPDQQSVTVNDQEVLLTRSEYALLTYFMVNQGRVLTKEAIAENLSGDDADQAPSIDFVYSHIKNLRKKLTAAGSTDYLQSVYGIGYKFGGVNH